jgi:protein ImuB
MGLEIAGSLRLFGGLEALLARVRSELSAQVSTRAITQLAAQEKAHESDQSAPLQLALAPTPRAAFWLARAGLNCVCHDAAVTLVALRQVPLSALPLTPDVSLRLTGFGLRRLGEVLALPRDAIGARLGKAFVLDLARALGELADPQPWFTFPEHFEQRIELPAAVEHAPVLLFAAQRLIGVLAGWLAARNAAVRDLSLEIGHGSHPPSRLNLRFSAPVHGTARIERVLKEHLDRLHLPSPAVTLALEVRRHESRDGRSRGLLDASAVVAGDAAEVMAELLDRLAARLGDRAVRRIACHADHRPEQASRSLPHGRLLDGGRGGWRTARMAPLRHPRPLWLLAQPQPLGERHGRPYWRGPLTMLSGPERIEGGWWDAAAGKPVSNLSVVSAAAAGELPHEIPNELPEEKSGDIRRDYFIALDTAQRWCWIYRQQGKTAGWFLHGWFS